MLSKDTLEYCLNRIMESLNELRAANSHYGHQLSIDPIIRILDISQEELEKQFEDSGRQIRQLEKMEAEFIETLNKLYHE